MPVKKEQPAANATPAATRDTCPMCGTPHKGAGLCTPCAVRVRFGAGAGASTKRDPRRVAQQ